MPVQPTTQYTTQPEFTKRKNTHTHTLHIYPIAPTLKQLMALQAPHFNWKLPGGKEI